MATFQLLLKSTISLMTVFLFGSAGEILTEKSGHLNMGIPGIMCLGGLGGVLGELLYLNCIDINTINPFLCVAIPIIFCIIFGALGGLIFSFFCVTLRCNQNVVGLLLTTFCGAISTYFLSKCGSFPKYEFLSRAGVYFSSLFFPGKTSDLNFFCSVFLSHGFLTYFAIIIIIVLALFLNKTRIGLSLRAVGENPSSADSTGISVTKYRYLATIIGAAIASLGGLYLIMDRAGGMDPAGMDIESYGWLAVALVIFSMWKPSFALIGSFIFAFFYTLPLVLLDLSGPLKEFMNMIPYLMTLIILIITSIFKFKNSQAPEGLGQSYFREDR